jgi:hypothetical protein
MLPQIAKGDANKLWIVPSEMGKALEGLGGILGGMTGSSAAGNSAAKAEKPIAARPAAAIAAPPVDPTANGSAAPDPGTG